ncbi:MAG: hypothetical protein KF773_20375 [Deltaproteobacteria bacterium]|nr:hypothetical protein [Deltaproteobacteria bacterium]MCW5804331.1 hypothetical protein [Deltaproteobacteria bacterium]
MKLLRDWGVALAFLVALGATLAVAPRTADAGCSTTSVCTRSGGGSVCRTVQSCSAPRVRSCSFVNRCTPQRTCTTRGSTTVCSTRDVCRRVEVCH